MGVINVTPDSFYDGGRWLEPDDAIRQGLRMLDEGADILDVGGESTRPGAGRSEADEELRRVLPVVRELAGAGAVVSIDTMRAKVADRAIAAGARLVNDVSGGRAEPELLDVVAECGVPVVLMHWRGHSAAMQQQAAYDDVVAEVVAELRSSVDAAGSAGVPRSHLAIDPGLGFAKLAVHNWALLAHLDALTTLGFPVVVGASRKRFLGELLAAPDGDLRAATGRGDATTAITALAAAAGAWCVRVHDVRPSADAVRVVARWADG